jgi:hypothetical protein
MLRQVDLGIATPPEFAQQQVVSHLLSSQVVSYDRRFREGLFHFSSPFSVIY